MDLISSLSSTSKYSGSSTLNSRSGSHDSDNDNSDFVAVLQQEDHSGKNKATRQSVDNKDEEEKERKERNSEDSAALDLDVFPGNIVLNDDVQTVEPAVTESIDNTGNIEESPYNKYLFADYNASTTEVSASSDLEVTGTVEAETLTAKAPEGFDIPAGKAVPEAAQDIRNAVLEAKTAETESSETASAVSPGKTETVKSAVENVVQTAKATGEAKMPAAAQTLSADPVVSIETTEPVESSAEVVIQSISDTASETITVKSETAAAGNENSLRQTSESGKADSSSLNSAKLETENVKIVDVKYNQPTDGGKQDRTSDDSAAQQENSEGLLKTLTGKMNNFMQRMQNRQQSSGKTAAESSVFSSSRANESMFKSVAASVTGETIKSATNTEASNTDSANTLKALSGLTIDSPRTGLAEANGLANGNSVSTAATQMNSSAADRVETVQQIIETVQQFAPVQNTGRESNMTMNVEVGSLGKMQVFLEQKENSLRVVIESDTEQGRQEMMNQKDELAQQLRMMGYKDLSVEVGGQNQQQYSSQQQEKNSGSGNEDSENVKLAGNDELDLAEILSMS